MTASPAFPNISHRRIATNGITLHIAEQKPAQPNGKLVLMCHGFPESWYSWRHQFQVLSDAGYHAVAPDMRGYGDSDKPHPANAYNQVEVVNDIIGLIPALGYETAIVLGHDWGGPTAWSCALHHPDKVSAVGVLSVPFSPRPEAPPLDTSKAFFIDQFFYQLYFQDEGIAEAEFEADIRTCLRKFYHMGSAQMDISTIQPKPADADMFSDLPDPAVMGEWLSDEDLEFYIQEFTRSGFRGPLNYYRNHNLTWELTAGAPNQIHQPSMFVAGDKDGVILMAAQALQAMPEYLTDLRINTLLPNVGHWTQQEDPVGVNAKIMEFLQGL